jgi:uncharacterized protein
MRCFDSYEYKLMEGKMWKFFNVVAIILLVIGGLNWGLVAFLDLNLVTLLFGETMAAQVVYGLVALAAVYKIFCLAFCCGCHGKTVCHDKTACDDKTDIQKKSGCCHDKDQYPK